ncbi:hypothetical protein GOODEAATRI_014717 [Goodea atripinnis]|uniref:Uncharacterized protein n=1 Tax=Goodea atripinnis TaxID=208336 RepID=A0ABV0NAP0_9TELE
MGTFSKGHMTFLTNYNNVPEAGSDSDDEDKLHIVEEEGSLADAADCDSTLPDDEHPSVPSWDPGTGVNSFLPQTMWKWHLRRLTTTGSADVTPLLLSPKQLWVLNDVGVSALAQGLSAA